MEKWDILLGKYSYKIIYCGYCLYFLNCRQCTGGKGDSLIPTDMADEFDAGEFPSLEQVLEWN